MSWEPDDLARAALEAYRAELDESITQPEENWGHLVSRVESERVRKPVTTHNRRRILGLGAIFLGVLGVALLNVRPPKATPAFHKSAETLQHIKSPQYRNVKHRRASVAEENSSHE